MARSLRKLSLTKTKEVLQYLHAYLDGHEFRNKKQAIVELLRCGERTAARLMKRDGSYDAKIRYDWAVRICVATGNDVLKVLPDQARTWVHLMQGWDSFSSHSSFKAAAAIGEALVLRANGKYLLDAAFMTGIEANAVTRLELYINSPLKPNEVHILAFRYKEDNKGEKGFWFRHVLPDGSEYSDRLVDHTAVDKHINNIYEKFRNEWQRLNKVHN